MSDSKIKKPESMTFEEAVGELDEIVKRIDAGEADLETMMKEHKRGQLLVVRCKELLDSAEKQIQKMDANDLP
ncbi:MAG: exodeoxyribonuclease VII small subunit [Phycisphaerae bacterium]|jgi:exodeoxyribonuclease VII small subunit|nr:exodeoxyribonuclease VII small subunit [Phycisphaerae bacterium]